MEYSLFHTQIFNWFTSFVLTLVIEVPIYICLSRNLAPNVKTISIRRAALVGGFASLVTHPLLYMGLSFVNCSFLTYVAIGEPLVAIVETFVLFSLCPPIRLSRAAAISFIANAASFGVGVLLRYFL